MKIENKPTPSFVYFVFYVCLVFILGLIVFGGIGCASGGPPNVSCWRCGPNYFFDFEECVYICDPDGRLH